MEGGERTIGKGQAEVNLEGILRRNCEGSKKKLNSPIEKKLITIIIIIVDILRREIIFRVLGRTSYGNVRKN